MERVYAARRACHNRGSPPREIPVSVAATPPALLAAVGFPPSFLAGLAARYPVLGPFAQPVAAALREMPAHVRASIRALVTMGSARTGADLLEPLPALGLIAVTGSGYEGVDLAAAGARGIAVTHSPGASADSVADVALGLLIASIRRFSAGRVLIDSGDWAGNAARTFPVVRGLTGRRVGIYGLGLIGAKIARRIAACDATIGYHSRRARSDVGYRYFDTLHALAEWAEALVIAVRADASNRHAVDGGVLRALGPDAHVVNIARGSVIDEAALIAALRDGGLAGAGLDVYEHEPQVPDELRALANVVLTPHIGGGTLEAQAATQAMVLANLAAFFAGAPLPTPVPGSGAADAQLGP
jgi:glyoxylate reductase